MNKIFNQILDFLPDLVVIFNTDGKVVDVSQRVLDFYMKDNKELFIGKHISDFIVSEQHDELLRTFEELKANGYVKQHEFKIRKEDGGYFYGEIDAKSLRKEGDKDFEFVAIIRDITLQKTLLDNLRKSHKMFQLVLDNIPQFIFWKDIESKYSGCNRNFAKAAGFEEPESIVGKTDFDLSWKFEETESYYEIEHLVMESGIPEYNVIEPQLQADGKKRWLNINRIPLHDSEQKVIGLLGTYEDITERKIAEEELKESEEKFRNIANQSFMGIIIIQGGGIKYINEVLPSTLGYSIQEIINWTPVDFFKLIHPNDLTVAMKRFQRMQKGELGIHGAYLYRIFTKSRDIKWINLNSKVIQYQGKNAILVTLVDMTTQKEAESLIVEENKRLLKLNKLKEDLITRISHELRTPLTSIYGVSQYLLSKSVDSILSEELRPYVEISHRGILRLKELVENLLDASRLDSKKLNLKLTEIDLNELLKSCVEELSYLVTSRNLTLNLDYPKKLQYFADKSRLSQSIINLISNAIKNTPSGGKIFIKTLETGNFIDIIIKDTGVGLTMEEKQKLFQKFGKIERYGQNLDVDIEGAGLGLYISKEIVELHGGKIIVESDGRNKGSTFIIRLFKENN